jgi:ammonium transporter, Amt family
MDTGNTAWMLVATALVLFMTPGLAFFYGGMVRSKNVLGMLMQNFMAMGLVAVLWAVLGFTLAFGDFGNAGWLGNFDFIGLKDVGALEAVPLGTGSEYGELALTIPLVLFAAYQMTFAVITPALITGATADRMKFGAYVLFIGLWAILVYAPVAPSSTSTPGPRRWA